MKGKKLISAVMSLVMLFSMLPAAAAYEEETELPEAEEVLSEEPLLAGCAHVNTVTYNDFFLEEYKEIAGNHLEHLATGKLYQTTFC